MDNTKKRIGSGFALVVTSHTLNHAYDSLPPILYPSMMAEFGLSYSLVGMIVMGYRLSGGSLQLVMGFLGRFVRRKILLGAGMAWQCIFNSFMALGQGFQQIFICRTLAGIGSSPQHPIGASYIIENSSKGNRGKALGINIAAEQIGRFITPLLGSLVLISLGWRATMLAFSVPGMLIGIAFFLLREPRRSREWSGAQSLKLLLRGMHDVLADKAVVAVLIIETVMAFRVGAGDFLPSFFVRDLRMTSFDAGILFTVFAGAGLPAPYLLGVLSDRFGRVRVVMSAVGTAAFTWFLLSYVEGVMQLIPVVLLIGFVNQGVGGVIQAFVADSTTEENRDLVYGIYFTLAFGLGALSPVVLGYITDVWGFRMNFRWVAFVSCLTVIASGVLLSRLPQKRE